MLHMLEAFGDVLSAFWNAPGKPTRWKVVNRIYTGLLVLVVGFAAFVIFT